MNKFIFLTDTYGNEIIVQAEEVTTIENDRTQTVLSLKDGRKITIRQTVREVWEYIDTMR